MNDDYALYKLNCIKFEGRYYETVRSLQKNPSCLDKLSQRHAISARFEGGRDGDCRKTTQNITIEKEPAARLRAFPGSLSQ